MICRYKAHSQGMLNMYEGTICSVSQPALSDTHSFTVFHSDLQFTLYIICSFTFSVRYARRCMPGIRTGRDGYFSMVHIVLCVLGVCTNSCTTLQLCCYTSCVCRTFSQGGMGTHVTQSCVDSASLTDWVRLLHVRAGLRWMMT